jgi:hypothetical protein
MSKNIKGIEKLTEVQTNHMLKVNEFHKRCVGSEYKDGIDIVKCWLENETVCVRLKNGEWYHYSTNGTWY